MQKIKNCSERKKRIDAKCKRKNDAEKEVCYKIFLFSENEIGLK